MENHDLANPPAKEKILFKLLHISNLVDSLNVDKDSKKDLGQVKTLISDLEAELNSTLKIEIDPKMKRIFKKYIDLNLDSDMINFIKSNG